MKFDRLFKIETKAFLATFIHDFETNPKIDHSSKSLKYPKTQVPNDNFNPSK